MAPETTKQHDDFLAGLLEVTQDGLQRAITDIRGLRQEIRDLRDQLRRVPADFWWMAERIEILEHQLTEIPNANL